MPPLTRLAREEYLKERGNIISNQSLTWQITSFPKQSRQETEASSPRDTVSCRSILSNHRIFSSRVSKPGVGTVETAAGRACGVRSKYKYTRKSLNLPMGLATRPVPLKTKYIVPEELSSKATQALNKMKLANR